jgi:hypothetical protein
MASVHPGLAVLPAELRVTSSEILVRQVAIPLASVYVLFMAMVVLHARATVRGDRPEPRPRTGPPPAWGALVRFVLVTVSAGYGTFLAVVGIFYLILGAQDRQFLIQGVTGGAFLAYGVAAPAFLILARTEAFLRSRRGGAR